MADEVARLRVVIDGDASSLASTISGVEKELNGLSDKSSKLSASTQKAVSSLETGTLKYRDVVDSAKKTLEEKNSVLAKTEKSYKENSKSIKSNIKDLGEQRTSVEKLIHTKQDEVKTLEYANTIVNKGSLAYKDNVKAITWTKDELSSLTGEYGSISSKISEQELLLEKETAGRDNAVKAVNSASKAYTELNNNLKTAEKYEKALSMQENGQQMKELGGAIDTVAKPLYTVGTLMTAGAVASAKFAIDFENSFADVEKTANGTDEDLAKLKQDIIDLGTVGINGNDAIPMTTAQLNELASTAGQLNVPAKEIAKFTEVMAQMGTATNLAGAEGTATMARFMNVMGVSQDEVRNVASSVVELGNNSATTEAEIMSMALRMGKFGSSVGMSASSVLGYSAALSSLGIEAQMGGSAMGRIWLDIDSAVSQGGDSLTTFAKYSGKSANEFKQQWSTDSEGAFNGLLEGLSGVENLNTALADMGINNTYDIQAMLALASKFDLVTESINLSNTAYEEKTALQEEFDKKNEKTAQQLLITKNNFVEAGRSIGESFLPMIQNGSADLTKFAQNIANMDDAQKQGLITTGKWVIGLGAVTKATTSSIKGVGGWLYGMGKIKEMSGAGGLVGTLAKVIPKIGLVGLAVAGVGVATYAGVKAYQNYQYELRNFGDGLEESTKQMTEQRTATDELNSKLEERKQLKLTIETSESVEEIEKAQTKLDELNKYLIDNFSEYLSIESISSGIVSDKDIANLKEAIELKIRLATIDSASDLNDNKPKYDNAKEDLPKKKEEYNALVARNQELAKEKAIVDQNVLAWENYKNSKDYINASDAENANAQIKASEKLNRELKKEGFSGYKGMGDASLAFGKDGVRGEEIEKIKSRIKDLSEMITDYEKSILQFNESTRATMAESINQLPNAIEQGGTAVQDKLQMIRDLGNGAGFTFDEMGFYANQAALKLNGFESATEAAADGTEAMSNTVQNCVDTMQQWGYSAEEANIQGALLKNGFNNISEAAATDGGVGAVAKNFEELGAKAGLSAEEIVRGSALIRNGFTDIGEAVEAGKLEVIAQQATDIGHALGKLPANQHISITADGDFQVITDVLDETGKKIAELNNTTGQVTLTVEDEATPTVEQVNSSVEGVNGKAANIVLNAETNNYEVLDEAGIKIADIDGKTGVVTVCGQTENMDSVEEANALEDDMEDTSTELKVSGVTEGMSEIEKAIAYQGALKDVSVTHKVTYEQVGTPGAVNMARGTNNAKAGLAVINDERGVSDPRELVEHKGKHYMFEGKDVPIYLDKGDKVYTASQTKAMLGGVPHYAGGKNNEAWDSAKSDRDHYRKTTFSIISAEEELEWLEEMKRKFANDAEVIKQITEEIVRYTRQAWQETIDNMDFGLQMGWKSEAEYYEELWQLRDNTPEITPDTKEWRDMTLELNKYAKQNVKDSNDVSKAWLDTRAKLNDWDEIGDSMGDALQRVANTNKQALADGLITADEYKETMLGTFESMANGYMSYADNWISNEKKYNNMSAAENIAAIKRKQVEIKKLAGSLDDMTDEEYVITVKLEEDVQNELYDALSAGVDAERDKESWHKQQADVYGWDFMDKNDTEVKFWQRVYDKEIANYNDDTLSETERAKAQRKADEAKMAQYQAQGNAYDEMLDDVTDRISEIKDSFSQKAQTLQKSWEVDDRKDDKTQVVADMEKYKNAVTIEGQEKYKQLEEELKRIEREEELYNLELEEKAILEQLESEYAEVEKLKETHLNELRISATAVNNLLVTANESINKNSEDLISQLKELVHSLKPNVNVEMNNTYTVADVTDAKAISSNVFSRLQSRT